ncbi:hypothetical protein AB3S75_013140 [Citrus x aurantiifolia]
MLNFCKLLIFIFLVSAVSLSSSSNVGSKYSQAECLKVLASSFMSSLNTTIDVIQQVVPVISKFANLFSDFRLTNTISDCLDLFDFSVDELSWSIFASQNPADLFAGLVWNVAGYVVGIRVLLEDGGLLGMGWSVAGCLHWSVVVGVFALEEGITAGSQA